MLGAAILAIAALTLLPAGGATTRRLCLVCGPIAGADVLLNLIMFLPVGLGLSLLGASWRATLATALGVTVIVEILQFVLPLGRITSLSDIVSNFSGAVLGAVIGRRRRALLYPRSRPALRLATGGAAAWLLMLLLTAIGLRASHPDGPYIGQLMTGDAGSTQNPAQVLSANLSGMPLSIGMLPHSGELRDSLRARIHLDARIESLGASSRLTRLVRVVSVDGHEVAQLAQERHDLIFRSRVLASNLRLETPSIILRDALTRPEADEGRVLVIDSRREPGRLRITARGREQILPLHSGMGWMFLAPAATGLGAVAELVSALWVGIPLVAVGYWTGRRARRKARRSGDAFRLTGTAGYVLHAVPVLMALVAIGLAGISAAFGLSVPDPVVWAGAFLALGMGGALGVSAALTHDDRAHGVSRTPVTGVAITGPARAAQG